jgi:hypothetical protein
MASTPEDRATRAVPRLRRFLAELCELTERGVQGVRFSDEDHLAFMGLVFHAKQLEHARAVLALADHPDAALVARSMLEGLWQLKWAALMPGERALRWRMFALVYDWRVLKEKLAAGSSEVTPERQRKIERRLEKVHKHFLTRKARERLEKGLPLPADPYQPTWSGLSVRELAAAADGLDLYAGPYEDFSDRHHWSPGIGFGIRNQDARFHYDGKAITTEATVLSVAYQCLMETSFTLAEHLETGLEDRLLELTDRYLKHDEQVRAEHGEA